MGVGEYIVVIAALAVAGWAVKAMRDFAVSQSKAQREWMSSLAEIQMASMERIINPPEPLSAMKKDADDYYAEGGPVETDYGNVVFKPDNVVTKEVT